VPSVETEVEGEGEDVPDTDADAVIEPSSDELTDAL
jgi:hypothetical protein